MLCRCDGKGDKAVQFGYGSGILLKRFDELLHILHQFRVELGLKSQDALLGSEDFLLIFLQLLGDISLRLCQCLLAYPVRGHLVLERIAHLQIVAEHIIEAHLEAHDACALHFALLQLQQVVLA